MRIFFAGILIAAFGAVAPAAHAGERGLFVSVIQDPPVLSSRAAIEELVRYATEARVKTLFVQVYRAGRSWFPSEVADPGPYEACVKRVGEDALALLIRRAHAAGIEVHAWLNMLSLSDNGAAPLLRRYGTDVLTRGREAKGERLEDMKIDDQYFLEPSDARVREASVRLVDELVRAYPDLDGILFDYIRYPDVHPDYGYSKENVAAFLKATGQARVDRDDPAWQAWKRERVTELLNDLAQAARRGKPGLRVGATGSSPYARAMLEAFQDWPSWIERGIVDLVTFMSYAPDPREFERSILGFKEKGVDLSRVLIGVGAYKLTGSWARFDRQLEIVRASGAGGCVIFHYGSLREDPRLARSFVQDGGGEARETSD